MKPLILACTLISAVVLVPVVHAQCPQGPNASCVTAFSIAPSEVAGDQVHAAIGTATIHLQNGLSNFTLGITQGGDMMLMSYTCLGGTTGVYSNFNSPGGCQGTASGVLALPLEGPRFEHCDHRLPL
jgi:hypothetical protein